MDISMPGLNGTVKRNLPIVLSKGVGAIAKTDRLDTAILRVKARRVPGMDTVPAVEGTVRGPWVR